MRMTKEELLSLSPEKKQKLKTLILSTPSVGLDAVDFKAVFDIISQCKNLKSLTLFFNHLGPWDVDRLKGLDNALPKSLEKLSITSMIIDLNMLDAPTWGAFFDFFSRRQGLLIDLDLFFKNLNVLDVEGLKIFCNALPKNLRKISLFDPINFSWKYLPQEPWKDLAQENESNFKAYCDILSQCENLEIFSLLISEWGADHLKLLGNVLPKKLKHFSLGTIELAQWDDPHFKAYCDILSQCENLEIFYELINKLDENRLKILGKSLSKSKKLENISLSFQDFSTWGRLHFETFCNNIIFPCKNLRQLNLMKSNFIVKMSTFHLEVLRDALSDKNLKRLSVSSNNLGDLSNKDMRSFEIFSNIISDCQNSLEDLDLSENSLNDLSLNPSNVQNFCDKISGCRKLKTLYLNGNNLGVLEEHFKVFCKTISSCNGLELLNLVKNNLGALGDPEFDVLCNTIAGSNLKKLCLSSNNFTDFQSEKILKAISECKTLLHVSMHEENIAPEKMKELKEILKIHKALAHLPGEKGSRGNPPSLILFSAKKVSEGLKSTPEGQVLFPENFPERFKEDMESYKDAMKKIEEDKKLKPKIMHH